MIAHPISHPVVAKHVFLTDLFWRIPDGFTPFSMNSNHRPIEMRAVYIFHCQTVKMWKTVAIRFIPTLQGFLLFAQLLFPPLTVSLQIRVTDGFYSENRCHPVPFTVCHPEWRPFASACRQFFPFHTFHTSNPFNGVFCFRVFPDSKFFAFGPADFDCFVFWAPTWYYYLFCTHAVHLLLTVLLSWYYQKIKFVQ